MEKWKKLLRDDETNRRNSGLLFSAESGRRSLILFCTGYKKRDRVTTSSTTNWTRTVRLQKILAHLLLRLLAIERWLFSHITSFIIII